MAETKKYVLTAENIDRVGEDLRTFFGEGSLDRKKALQVCLMAEEALLKYRDTFGDGVNVELRTSENRHGAKVRLTVYCDRLDPFGSDGADSIMTGLVAASVDADHVWRYTENPLFWNQEGGYVRGRNDITFKVAAGKQVRALLNLGNSLAAGIILAFLSRLFFSPETCRTIAEQFVFPIAGVYTGLLSVMAIVLVFCALPLCIVQYGSGTSFKDLTGRLLARFSGSTAFWVLFFAAFGLSVGTIQKTGLDGVAVAKSILSIFTDFFPSNIVAPFLNFNCMQVIIVGIMFGMAFLKMGEGAAPLVVLIDKMNLVAVIVNHWFNDFVHIYVGMMAYYLVILNQTQNLGRLLGFGLSVFVAALIVAGVTAIAAAYRLKVSVWSIGRKFLSSFLVNLSSASVGASFTNMFDELVNAGVNVGYTGMAANLGTVLYKPMYAIYLVACGFFAAGTAGELSLGVIFQIIIFSIVLPASIPNIQGGAAAAILLLISQLGFASETAELLVTLNVLLQFVIVPADIFVMQCEILLQAAKEGMLDEEKLRQ